MSLDPSVSSTGGTTASTGSASNAPAKSSTTTNLENLLVQYANSESQDVQNLLGSVAAQLGVSLTDVRAAAREDAQAQKDAQAAAEKATTDAAVAAKAEKTARDRQRDEQARRAAKAYHHHRVNNWYAGYAPQVSAANGGRS